MRHFQFDGMVSAKKFVPRVSNYHFSISPSAAKTSELQLGVSLYEKDGRPTVGGGKSMQIHLAGFEPKMEEKTKPK